MDLPSNIIKFNSLFFKLGSTVLKILEPTKCLLREELFTASKNINFLQPKLANNEHFLDLLQNPGPCIAVLRHANHSEAFVE